MAATAPAPLATASAPQLARVRIGRRAQADLAIDEGGDSRSQANDAFPTVRNGIAPGEHFSPSSDRFGSIAFSRGADLGTLGSSPNLITGDSIHVRVIPGEGIVTQVTWYGAIVSGPHAGLAPPFLVVGPNGFFSITADSCRDSATGAVVVDHYFVDLDDEYFRGGDRLLYYWAASDELGNLVTDPPGMTRMNWPPAWWEAAELATGGLLEISFLPSISWSHAYIQRIQADGNGGKLDPTPAELANSTQRSCILYSQIVDSRRRSGDVHRTSFMYTLDNLGYRGWYDVYDVQGYGNTNNQLGSRASVLQTTGYALIIQDNGRASNLTMPDGSNLDSEKIDQASWFRAYLATASTSEIGTHSLWLLGENTLQEKPNLQLYNIDMGVRLVTSRVTVSLDPDVRGDSSFTWASGYTANFATPADHFTLHGDSTATRDWDGLAAVDSTVARTHRFASFAADTTFAEGAIVMRANPAAGWNTVMMSFAWSDIRDLVSIPPTFRQPENVLMDKILQGTMMPPCWRGVSPTDAGPPPSPSDLPAATVLHQNVPNPFNPATTIAFDVAQSGAVRLQVFDVAGRLVRTLVEGARPTGRYQVGWDGLDSRGLRVGSGVYICRLSIGDETATCRMVLVK